jgi:hypothetical protein
MMNGPGMPATVKRISEAYEGSDSPVGTTLHMWAARVKGKEGQEENHNQWATQGEYQHPPARHLREMKFSRHQRTSAWRAASSSAAQESHPSP